MNAVHHSKVLERVGHLTHWLLLPQVCEGKRTGFCWYAVLAITLMRWLKYASQVAFQVGGRWPAGGICAAASLQQQLQACQHARRRCLRARRLVPAAQQLLAQLAKGKDVGCRRGRQALHAADSSSQAAG